jgi:cytochrome c oxidase subunit 3
MGEINKIKEEVKVYHLIKESILPVYIALGILNLIVSIILKLHQIRLGNKGLIFNLLILIMIILLWLYNLIMESIYQGKYTYIVVESMKVGFYLFLLTEIIFFISFFWAYLHSSLSPSENLGGVWPPMGIEVIDAFSIPLINTGLLTLSSVMINNSLNNLKIGLYVKSLIYLEIGILQGILFLMMQIKEYKGALFSIGDGIYGTIFYILTGFHGLHVLIGIIGLIISYLRLREGEFTTGKDGSLGYYLASRYWIFVDIVWIVLYILLYCWGNYSILDNKNIINYYIIN